MTTDTTIPRTVAQAKKQRHAKIRNLSLEKLGPERRVGGIALAAAGAKPGDIAWIGPCEPHGKRVICYYDANLDPSDCRSIPCKWKEEEGEDT